MTVNLQALAIKSEVKVAMRYKNLQVRAPTERDTYSRIFCKITQSFVTSLGLPYFVFTSHSNCLEVFISHSNLNFAFYCQCL